MSQQVFEQYWPVGNASAEEAIPGAAILQTREGKDEPINLSGAMVWDSGNSLWVPVSQSNPLEARVRQLETLIGALNASKVTDPDAGSAALLALLRGILAQLADPATSTKQDTIKGVLDTLATESTLDDVKTAVESIAGEDFATQTTLAQVLAKLSSDPATETTQGAVKTAVEALATLIENSRLKTEATLKGSLAEAVRNYGTGVAFYRRAGALANATTETVADITTPVVIDALYWILANTDGAERLKVEPRKSDGTYGEILGMTATAASGNGMSWGNVANFGLSPFEVLKNDSQNSTYAIGLRGSLICPNGVRIRITNSGSTPRNVGFQAIVRTLTS